LTTLRTLRYLLAPTRNKSGKNRGGERGEEKREEGDARFAGGDEKMARRKGGR